MAELILFTGTYDHDFVEKAAADAEKGRGASQPAATEAGKEEHRRLKTQAQTAKMHYRKTTLLEHKLRTRTVDAKRVTSRQWLRLNKLRDGSLLRERNEAVFAFGHGSLLADNV